MILRPGALLLLLFHVLLLGCSSNSSSSTGGGNGGGSSSSAPECKASHDCGPGRRCADGACVACPDSPCAAADAQVGDRCEGNALIHCGTDADGCPAETTTTCSSSCDTTAGACCGADGQPCCPGQACAPFNSCQTASNTCKYVCGGNACADMGFDSGSHCMGNAELQCQPPFDTACNPDVLIPDFCCPYSQVKDCGSTACVPDVGTCDGCAPNECTEQDASEGGYVCGGPGVTALHCGTMANGCFGVLDSSSCPWACKFGQGCCGSASLPCCQNMGSGCNNGLSCTNGTCQ